MSEEELLLEEIYHALGNHVQIDLDRDPITKESVFSAKSTVNWIINKIELYYKNKQDKEML